MLEAKDIDPESDFYFKIESFNNYTIHHDYKSVDSLKYKVSRKPKNEIFENETIEELSNMVVFEKYYQWTKIIREFNNIDIERENPIISFYEDEFFNNFKIVDQDADINPFDLKQQLALSEHADYIIKIFNESEDDLSTQIVDETIQLKKNLTTKSKNVVFRHLCKIWAMIRLKGIDTIKLVMTKGFDKLVDLSVSKGIRELIDLF